MKVTKSIVFTSEESANLLRDVLIGMAVEILGQPLEGMIYVADIPSFYGSATVETKDEKNEVTE